MVVPGFSKHFCAAKCCLFLSIKLLVTLACICGVRELQAAAKAEGDPAVQPLE